MNLVKMIGETVGKGLVLFTYMHIGRYDEFELASCTLLNAV